MNNYLKELAEMAKINSTFRVSKTRAGKVVEVAMKKHELVKVHTARRSFATNMYNADIHPITIMKITGHRTRSIFDRYDIVTSEDLKLAAEKQKALLSS